MSRTKCAVIDFDGTIVEHKFPKIGKAMPGAFEVMKELKEKGWKLILWTCRENDGYKIDKQFLKEAVEFCQENGVEFDAVNEPCMDCEFRPEKGLKRKVYGDVYIDDRNLGGFPGWDVVRRMLINDEPLIGTCVLVCHEGQILAGHNVKRGRIEAPGGKVEKGESVKTAAIREFEEETGCLLDDIEFVGTCKDGEWTTFVYKHEGYVEAINTESDKCHGWSWHKELPGYEPWEMIK